MRSKTEIWAEAKRLRAYFEEAGAQVTDAAILQPAETLLDLYGEDIRARAYVTHDPLRGEQMLRPDFTVPVVQQHMADQVEPARYTYAGEVFRKQEDDSDRASEYVQVGLEIFDGAAPEEADAEVFSLFARVLEPLGLRPATGDIGILTAAVEGLTTSPERRAALMRHLWRPRRFRGLIERFAGRKPTSPYLKSLLKEIESGKDPLATQAPQIGLRSEAEIRARLEILRQDAALPALDAAEVDLLEQIVSLRDNCPSVLEQLHDIEVDLPTIAPAVQRFEKRLEALSDKGIDVGSLEFEASFGRTTLEYYDGFVFGFMAAGRPDLPAIATGGRYDALTRVLGRGREMPAVGGVLRPGLILDLGGKT